VAAEFLSKEQYVNVIVAVLQNTVVHSTPVASTMLSPVEIWYYSTSQGSVL
jgi:hypothetical protein